MNWVRIAVGITRDPSIVGLSEAVGVSVPTTTGHVVGVLTSLPDSARTGDLSGVSDSTLELWAMWRGKRGAFAAAFRAHLCTPQGVVRSWEKYNGAAIREADATKERVKKWREERRANALVTRNVRGNERRTYGVANGDVTLLRDVTGRDGVTNNNNNNNNADAAAPAPLKPVKASKAPTSKYPHFPTDDRQAAFDRWTRKRGPVDMGRLVVALEGCWRHAGEDGRPTRERLLWALDTYLAVGAEGRSAPFVTINKAAEMLVPLARLRDTYQDALAINDAAHQLIHGHRATT